MMKSKRGLRQAAPTILNRRLFMQALGLGGAAMASGAVGPFSRRVWAQNAAPPTRLIFWITPHGTVWNHMFMSPGGLGSGVSSAALGGLGDNQWSDILRPLSRHAAQLTIVEGLARTVSFAYEAVGARSGGVDLNRHHFGQAMLLTCQDPMQRPGSTCIGGARSVDQVIGDATVTDGRWATRVYGANHQHPYSFTSAGTGTTRIANPRDAFDEIVGAYTPAPSTSGPLTRAERIQQARASVLDFAAHEYELVEPRVGSTERARLETHRGLIRELERNMGTTREVLASCDPSWSDMGHLMDQFGRVMTLALACDLTRMITYVTPPLRPEEFGLSPGANVHQDYAHRSVVGTSSYTAEGERGMVEFNRFYAQHFANFLDQLEQIPEGDGSVLDHSMVVWITELGTGNHDLHDLPVVIAGGGNGYLHPGRYVRYPRDMRIRAGWSEEQIGPSHSQLYVTLMQGMGMNVDRFGVPSVPLVDGSTLQLQGALDAIRG